MCQCELTSRSERSCDANHDVTSPSDVSYDVGRVSANQRHGTARERERENLQYTVIFYMLSNNNMETLWRDG